MFSPPGGLSVTADLLQVRTWGTRGSLPVSGPEFVTFGGNTTCIEVRCGAHVLLFDAGSGLLPAGCALRSEGVTRAHLLFTHCHYDHIMGFPFFDRLFDPASTVDVWSGHGGLGDNAENGGHQTTEAMLRAFMRPPFFPVCPDICPARIRCHDFSPGDVLTPEPGITLHTALLAHPGGSVGYRVTWKGRSVAIVTDTEHAPGVLDPGVLSLIKGVDLFVYDACYTEAEMPLYRGFGHSSWQHAVALAQAAEAAQVAMTHHAPWRTDTALLALEAQAQAVFPGAFFARDGQVTRL